jgi:putative N6-adenine-specific DNA methylase
MDGTAAELSLFAVTAPGLEPLLADELRELGIVGAPEAGGVAWTGGVGDLHRVNLHSRLATRVLVRVAEFRARTFFELERHGRRVPWERFVPAGDPVSLRVSCRKSKLYHEKAVAQRIRAAIEERTGAGAEVDDTGDDGEMEGDAEGAAQLLVVRFLHDRCTISADSSGAPLYRRGYRQAVARAPLRETLAAALLRAAGWTPGAPLLDPMCGSGVIPIEAALIARDVAPGIATASRAPRTFSFERWPDHDPDAWTRRVDEASARIRDAAGAVIIGSDRDAGAIEAAHANAERAGVAGDASFLRRTVSEIEPAGDGGFLVSNPPYGVRVSESSELRNLYAALGRVARERLPGWTVALLSADARLEAQLRVPLEERVRTSNGGIPVRIVAGRVSIAAP